MWWQHTKVHTDELSLAALEELRDTLVSYRRRVVEQQPIIYIEMPWMNTGFAGGNPATTMKLVKVAAAVQVVATQANYRVEWANVAAWRSMVFGKGSYKKKDAKLRAIEWAIVNTGLEIGKDDNAADSCCIAQYGHLKEQGL